MLHWVQESRYSGNSRVVNDVGSAPATDDDDDNDVHSKMGDNALGV